MATTRHRRSSGSSNPPTQATNLNTVRNVPFSTGRNEKSQDEIVSKMTRFSERQGSSHIKRLHLFDEIV
eukprot:1000212-Prorocentrum_minimum.AAC.1